MRRGKKVSHSKQNSQFLVGCPSNHCDLRFSKHFFVYVKAKDVYIVNRRDERTVERDRKVKCLREREICRSWVFKELNFPSLRRPNPEILSRSARIELERLRREAILEVKEGAELI